MINPVAAGRIFESSRSVLTARFGRREQEAIAHLDTKRNAVVQLEKQLQRLRDDSLRFGESQGDPAALSDRLRQARREFEEARNDLARLRQQQRVRTESDNEQDSTRASLLNNYLEQRVFERNFPDDARYLKTFQIYDSSGILQVFSSSTSDLIGTVVDLRI